MRYRARTRAADPRGRGRGTVRWIMQQLDERKCACPKCQCPVEPRQAVIRDGKRFCSQACAYECTDQTCVCVHDHCEDDNHPAPDPGTTE
jgi:hypothetical protein